MMSTEFDKDTTDAVIANIKANKSGPTLTWEEAIQGILSHALEQAWFARGNGQSQLTDIQEEALAAINKAVRELVIGEDSNGGPFNQAMEPLMKSVVTQ